jgi:hypothetical protein
MNLGLLVNHFEGFIGHVSRDLDLLSLHGGCAASLATRNMLFASPRVFFFNIIG